MEGYAAKKKERVNALKPTSFQYGLQCLVYSASIGIESFFGDSLQEQINVLSCTGWVMHYIN